MTKTLLFSGITTALILSSCGEPETITETRTEQKRKDIILSETDLFDTGKILAFLENDEKFIEDANKMFLMGLNSFRNQKNLDSADYYLRQSILKEPSGKAYYELGNVFMDKEDFDNALKAYDLAENLDFQPFSKILYNKSCLYSLKKEPEMSGQYLEYAIQAGYNNIEHLNKDEDLKELRDTHHFKKAVEKGLRGMSNSENLFWLQFKKLFPKYPKPHTLQMVMDEKNLSNLQYISYEFEKYISEMRDEKFSREVSKGFYHYAQVYETDKFVAIVYIVKDEFMGDYAPLLYRMATFTHDGQLIDKKNIGGRENLSDHLMEATLNKDRTIDIDVLEATYENDPDDHGYYDNKIVSTSKVSTIKYKVSSSGKIIQLEGMENVSASSE